MIGKTVIGRGFKGCVSYLLDKVAKGEGELLEARGVRDFDKNATIRDFITRAKTNPNLTRCVWHTSLSFQDNLTSQQMLTIGKEWMKGMGLDSTQYIIVVHTDTDHSHIHIVANRINDEGWTIPDSNNWKRSEALCKELVRKHQLTPVPEERNESRINREKLKGRDLLKSDINRVVRKVLSSSKSFDEFTIGMAGHGFNCLVKFNSDQTIRGVSFERDGISIKASEIHKSLSAKNLAEAIELTRVRSAKQQVTQPDQSKSIQPPGNSKPKLGKLSKSLDTSEDDEKKRKKKGDFEMGM
ncbi:MAG: relaxase/mobilization nuclease domain-containing protein [Cytophagales bacterium]|nr:relaxase/mobilization nuclease domain-containing protein [Cytophagales bacterium]